jgi:hypothetical protein
MAQLLLEHGADMRATNADGKIAIELATPAMARSLADVALVRGARRSAFGRCRSLQQGGLGGPAVCVGGGGDSRCVSPAGGMFPVSRAVHMPPPPSPGRTP